MKGKSKRISVMLLVCILCVTMLAPVTAMAAYDLPETEKIIYGHSGEGRDLEAYRFGNGDNVMVLTFTLHGYEDNWNKDGLALVHTAEQVMKHLEQSYLLDSYDWTVYILPCCNPDGLYSGYTNYGPGRCTTTYITSSATVSNAKGIDMNRCFPASFSPIYSDRNYTSSSPMACLEARALASFIQSVKGSEVNVLVDVHGWLQQIITNSSRLRTALSSNFPNSKQSYVAGGTGYLSTYANSLGYEAALLELPAGYYSMSAFLSSSIVQRMINAVDDILQSVPLVCDQNGHQYEKQITEPTCTMEGYNNEVCAICGKAKVSRVPALGHSVDPNSVTVVTYPTACRNGLRQYSCVRCGRSDLTEVMPSVFSDVDAGAYYADALDRCYEAGYINGTSASTFSPDVTLSRGMLVTMLHRLHGEPSVDETVPFADVPAGAYYENAIQWAYSAGVIQGTSATTVEPDRAVTRQEAMAIFFRYVQYIGMDNGLRENGTFIDDDQLSDYAREAAQWSVANGIILGDEQGRLMPTGSATRAQSVTILQRVENYVQQMSDLQEPEESEPPELPAVQSSHFAQPTANS